MVLLLCYMYRLIFLSEIEVLLMLKNFKHQYTLLQCLFWISGSIMFGYSAVFMHYKGLTDTQVGIAAGSACFFLLFFQPLVDKMIQKSPWLTPKRMTLILMVIANVLYALMGFLALPAAGIIVFYILTNCVFNCASPLTTTMGMDYLNQGHKLNFLFSRGMGSFAYAVSAFILGQLVERFNAGLLPYAFTLSQVSLFILVLFMEDTHDKSLVPTENNSSSFLQILKENPVIRKFFIAFSLAFMANGIVTTYMVNVVYQAGGNDASFGVCCFINAVSEFPAMLVCNHLIKKYSCRTLLKISSFFFIIKMLILFFATNLYVVYFGYLLQAPSWGAFLAVSVFLVNTELEPKDRLVGQSIFNSLVLAAGGCIGNLIGGYIQDTLGLKVTIGVCIGIAIVGFLFSMSVKSEKTARTAS